MRKLILLLLILAETNICQIAKGQTWQDTVKTIETLFSRYHFDAPGCELAISRSRQLLYSNAWGFAEDLLERGRPRHHLPSTGPQQYPKRYLYL